LSRPSNSETRWANPKSMILIVPHGVPTKFAGFRSTPPRCKARARRHRRLGKPLDQHRCERILSQQFPN
jgi:hypothetical protein